MKYDLLKDGNLLTETDNTNFLDSPLALNVKHKYEVIDNDTGESGEIEVGITDSHLLSVIFNNIRYNQAEMIVIDEEDRNVGYVVNANGEWLNDGSNRQGVYKITNLGQDIVQNIGVSTSYNGMYSKVENFQFQTAPYIEDYIFKKDGTFTVVERGYKYLRFDTDLPVVNGDSDDYVVDLFYDTILLETMTIPLDGRKMQFYVEVNDDGYHDLTGRIRRKSDGAISLYNGAKAKPLNLTRFDASLKNVNQNTVTVSVKGIIVPTKQVVEISLENKTTLLIDGKAIATTNDTDVVIGGLAYDTEYNVICKLIEKPIFGLVPIDVSNTPGAGRQYSDFEMVSEKVLSAKTGVHIPNTIRPVDALMFNDSSDGLAVDLKIKYSNDNSVQVPTNPPHLYKVYVDGVLYKTVNAENEVSVRIENLDEMREYNVGVSVVRNTDQLASSIKNISVIRGLAKFNLNLQTIPYDKGFNFTSNNLPDGSYVDIYLVYVPGHDIKLDKANELFDMGSLNGMGNLNFVIGYRFKNSSGQIIKQWNETHSLLPEETLPLMSVGMENYFIETKVKWNSSSYVNPGDYDMEIRNNNDDVVKKVPLTTDSVIVRHDHYGTFVNLKTRVVTKDGSKVSPTFSLGATTWSPIDRIHFGRTFGTGAQAVSRNAIRDFPRVYKTYYKGYESQSVQFEDMTLLKFPAGTPDGNLTMVIEFRYTVEAPHLWMKEEKVIKKESLPTINDLGLKLVGTDYHGAIFECTSIPVREYSYHLTTEVDNGMDDSLEGWNDLSKLRFRVGIFQQGYENNIKFTITEAITMEKGSTKTFTGVYTEDETTLGMSIIEVGVLMAKVKFKGLLEPSFNSYRYVVDGKTITINNNQIAQDGTLELMLFNRQSLESELNKKFSGSILSVRDYDVPYSHDVKAIMADIDSLKVTFPATMTADLGYATITLTYDTGMISGDYMYDKTEYGLTFGTSRWTLLPKKANSLGLASNLSDKTNDYLYMTVKFKDIDGVQKTISKNMTVNKVSLPDPNALTAVIEMVNGLEILKFNPAPLKTGVWLRNQDNSTVVSPGGGSNVYVGSGTAEIWAVFRDGSRRLLATH